jgi:disulfide bond formation protein DsbB
MNAHNMPFRHTRLLMVAIGITCIAIVGGALWIQYTLHEDPCPLCIIQRYLFLLVAMFAFASAKNGRSAWLWRALAALIALSGVLVAARHMYLQAHPKFGCGFDALQPIVDSLPPAHWLPNVFKVAGFCETPYPPIIGLSLPTWALISFALCAIMLVWSISWNRSHVHIESMIVLKRSRQRR